MAITLLPPEFGESKGAILASRITRLGVIFLSFYIAALLSAGGFFFFVANRSAKLTASYNQLSSEVQKYKDKESGMVLLADRISILTVLQKDEKGFADVVEFMDNFISQEKNIRITEMTVAGERIRLTVVTPDTFTLGNFIEDITKNTALGEAILDSVTSDAGEYTADVLLSLR